MGDFDTGADDAVKYAEMAADLNKEDAEAGVDREPINFDKTELQPLEPDSAGREPAYQDDGRDAAVAREVFERFSGQPQHQPAQYQPPQIPDKMDDPIGHFEARTAQLEVAALHDYWQQQQITQQAQVQAFKQHISQSDEQGRAEIGEENFNSAMDHLLGSRRQELDSWAPDNSAHAQQLARQHGYQSAAAMKEAIVVAEIVQAAQTAAAHGIPLWAHALNLARERGYQVPVAATNSQKRHISRAITGARGNKDFDAAWDIYAKVHKAEDELARRPRR